MAATSHLSATRIATEGEAWVMGPISGLHECRRTDGGSTGTGWMDGHCVWMTGGRPSLQHRGIRLIYRTRGRPHGLLLHLIGAHVK